MTSVIDEPIEYGEGKASAKDHLCDQCVADDGVVCRSGGHCK